MQENNETISLLMNHASVRKYQDKPVSEEQLAAIIEAGQMASTSSSVQAYSVIAVTDPALKAELAGLAGNQAYIEQCPVFWSGARIYIDCVRSQNLICRERHRMKILRRTLL